MNWNSFYCQTAHYATLLLCMFWGCQGHSLGLHILTSQAVPLILNKSLKRQVSSEKQKEEIQPV